MKTHSQTIFYLSVEDSSFRLAENSIFHPGESLK